MGDIAARLERWDGSRSKKAKGQKREAFTKGLNPKFSTTLGSANRR